MLEIKKIIKNKDILRTKKFGKQTKSSELIGNLKREKVLFYNLDCSVAYYVQLAYLSNFPIKEQNCLDTFYTGISFAFSTEYLRKQSFRNVHNVFKYNNFLSIEFAHKDFFDFISGFENIIICDLLNLFKSETLYDEIANFIKALDKHNGRIFYCLPFSLYTAVSKITGDTRPNSSSENSTITRLILIDSLMQHFRLQFSIPVYRIIVPDIMCFDTSSFYNDRLSISQYFLQLERIKQLDEFLLTERPVLTNDKIAEAFFKIYYLEKFSSKNIVLSSNIKLTYLNFMNKVLQEKVTPVKLNIEETLWNELKIENYSMEYYLKNIEKNSNTQCSTTDLEEMFKRYVNSIENFNGLY